MFCPLAKPDSKSTRFSGAAIPIAANQAARVAALDAASGELKVTIAALAVMGVTNRISSGRSRGLLKAMFASELQHVVQQSCQDGRILPKPSPMAKPIWL
jgi:hypothetical protein